MFNTQVELKIKSQVLFVNEVQLNLDYPVSEAFLIESKIIVLFDPDSNLQRFGQFANLIALDAQTHDLIWTSELPTTETGDAYYKITSRKPLVAFSVCSYSCEIDLETGKISNKTFYK